jgi:hypothetical protein
MTISANPVPIGQPVTYTAVVTPPPDGGTVDFIDDGAAIVGCYSIAIAPGTGKAVCPVTYWTGGQHVIEAAFSGDSDFGPSASGLYGNTVRLPLPGYWLAARDGSVYGAGAAPAFGGTGGGRRRYPDGQGLLGGHLKRRGGRFRGRRGPR